VNIVFVCQKGELEIKSLLLAWSLRKTHGKDVRLIAAIPQYKDWGFITEETHSILNELEVECKEFYPSFGETYPIGNKISAMELLPPNEPGCFCDSDMLSLSCWKVVDALANNLAAAKPADLSTWGSSEKWEKVYEAVSAPIPERRVRLTVSQTLSFPYFNAGFVASSRPSDLASLWSDYAHRLDSDDLDIENKYPWLDQISLPIAMQQLGSWRPLSEFYNYPAHLKNLSDQEIGLCHYHSPSVILREPRLRALFNSAISEYPLLRKLVVEYEKWRPLLESRMPHKTYSERCRNILITGIPRSGTSYVTSMLDSQKDWLVINEPAEIFELLQTRTDASGIGQYYAECREKILLGLPVSNKVKNGKVIQDTAIVDSREAYYPEISRSDFWLGSKNTLAYMASMAYLVKLEWPIVALVRNPLDTLASWRKTFGHLSEANVNDFPIANPSFPAWATWQKNSLLEIAAQDNATLRRVLLWRLLARTLLQYQESIHLWRYEDLLADPNELVGKLNSCLDYRSSEIAIEPTSPRKRIEEYDSYERDLLLDLCAPELAAFKYTL
jgi:hypothetical protein